MRKLINMFRSNRTRLERDLERELRYHLDRRAEELMRSGVDGTEARRQAAIELGGPAQVQEAVRDTWVWRWLYDLLRDLRHGFRTMRQNPGFTAAALLTLALGIGVNITIFSFVNALLLRPLPIRDSSRVIAVYTSDFSGPAYGDSSYPDYLDFRTGADVFSAMAAYSMEMMSLSNGRTKERVLANVVTRNYFSVLGVDAVRGRMLSPDDQDAAVLSQALWQSAFASDPNVVGQSIVVNGSVYRVVGVAPKGFTGLIRGIPAELWVPLETIPGTADRLTSRGSRWLSVVGRLADGVEWGRPKPPST